MRLVCGGYEVVMAGEMVGRERERCQLEKWERGIFLSTLHSIFYSLRPWNPPLFIGGEKKNILSLMVSNLSPWFDLEGFQALAQSGNHKLEELLQKRVVELATLEQCRNRYGVNQLERTILGCSWMSSHHLHASFVKFDKALNALEMWPLEQLFRAKYRRR